jgi:hypothetical protein
MSLCPSMYVSVPVFYNIDTFYQNKRMMTSPAWWWHPECRNCGSFVYLKQESPTTVKVTETTFSTFGIVEEANTYILCNNAPNGTKSTPNVPIGDLVLVKEPNLPPLQWPIGIIIDVTRGSDGIVRVVSLCLKNHQALQRPVVKLCPLPVDSK